MTNTENRNIYYLHELSDYKVDSDYTDIRGWKVEDSLDRVIGKVENLIVNKQAERVVYVDVELSDEFIENPDRFTKVVSSHSESHTFVNKEGDKHVIIPVGLIDIDQDSKCVRTNQIETRLIASARRKSKLDIVDAQYEIDSINHYSGGNHSTDLRMNEEFYKRPEFQKSVFRAP